MNPGNTKEPIGYHQTVKIKYLKNHCPGISRKKAGKVFAYFNEDGKKIKDTATLGRIKSLVIPPAWKLVWVSPYSNSHLQATGIDARGRKQYRYHPDWNIKRSETKFLKLVPFAKTLPKLRTAIEGQINCKAITREKVVAIAVQLMSKAYIRIGNSSYAREYGSYGLTTLHDEHVAIHGDTIRLVFTGKKGVQQDIQLHDKRLARMIKSCRDIPGQELFQYYDEEGNTHVIDSGDINKFLHEVCGEGFSAKDFRTWAGTLHAFKSLNQLPAPATEAEFKHVTREVIKSVSKVLGNTVAVCRKYYIHPMVIESFQNGALKNFYDNCCPAKTSPDMADEEMLIEFLEKIELSPS